MRRVVLGVAVGAVVALAAATGVSAFWQAQAVVPVDAVGSGDLSISAEWVGGSPSWTPLYPTQSTSDATIRITSTSSGDNLRWSVRVRETVATVFEPHTRFQAWAGACGSGAPISADVGYGSFTSSTSTVDICVRYTLLSTAPTTLQGLAMNPQLTVIAEQVRP